MPCWWSPGYLPHPDERDVDLRARRLSLLPSLRRASLHSFFRRRRYCRTGLSGSGVYTVPREGCNRGCLSQRLRRSGLRHLDVPQQGARGGTRKGRGSGASRLKGRGGGVGGENGEGKRGPEGEGCMFREHLLGLRAVSCMMHFTTGRSRRAVACMAEAVWRVPLPHTRKVYKVAVTQDASPLWLIEDSALLTKVIFLFLSTMRRNIRIAVKNNFSPNPIAPSEISLPRSSPLSSPRSYSPPGGWDHPL